MRARFDMDVIRRQAFAVGELAVRFEDAGLYVPALDLYLDPSRAVGNAFVSHAHGDHVGGAGSGACFATPETLALLATRAETAPQAARPLSWDGAVELPIAPDAGGGTARLTVKPAGHVLGAAQLVIDHPGGRLVYTGDYRTGPGATHAAGAPVPCDTLVVESTFALPIFRFPDREATFRRLLEWCRRALDQGMQPVVLAYALGKAQEVIARLLADGQSVVAHGVIYRICGVYESLGVPLGVAEGRLRPYAAEPKRRGKRRPDAVLILPPGAEVRMLRARSDTRVAYVSGWALLDAALEQRRADVGFVISDHADHDDLMAMIGATGARRVYATHGDAAPLAMMLRARGLEATALESPPLDTQSHEPVSPVPVAEEPDEDEGPS